MDRISRLGRLALGLALAGLSAFAQSAGAINVAPGLDLSGNWAPAIHEDFPERIPGPELVNYLGLPIMEGARMFAESWDASRLTLPEHQCQVHVAPYIYRGPLNLHIWEEKDAQSQRVIAIKNYISTYEQTRTIWMDDRPHPSQWAAHTWMGFSTGKWEGNMLTVYTTHIKQGWLRRNGLPESDQATLIEHFIRHGEILTHVSIVTDPVYLTEPLIKTQNFNLIVQEGQNWLFPCDYVVEVANRPRGAVPHYLPGANPFLTEFADQYKIPREAALGGAETMYPEYLSQSKAQPKKKALVVAALTAGRAVVVAGPQQASAEIEVLPVQGNVYMVAGAGSNITVQTGPMGVIVVDTGLARMSDRVLAAIRKLSDKPIQYIVNTAADADHTEGNDNIRRAGVTITGANVAGNLTDAMEGAQIIAHENVLNRMSAPTGKQAPTPFGAWPTETYVSGQKELHFNDEPVQIIYQRNAHTDGDSLVLFRHSDVISTGDIFVTTSYPSIDVERGGGIQGEIDALNAILDIAIPKHDEEGGTYIIPGHGRICDEFDVLEYRDMVTIIRDRIQASIKKGMTLDQIKAARLTLDYDARYDAKSGPGAAENFVEAVYKSLTAKK
jgi:cyclase